MKFIFEKNNSAKRAGGLLVQKLKESAGKSVLLMLSGGSAFAILEHLPKDVIDGNLTISVLDERFNMDPKINNFCQLEVTNFFDNVLERGGHIIGTRIHKNETLPQAAQHFEKQLRAWRKRSPDGVVLATMGIGEDGHTAGIMPFPENRKLFSHLFEEENWVAGYDAGSRNQFPLRFTVTNTFLRDEVSFALVFVTGEKKRLVIEKLKSDLPLNEMPAQVTKQMKGVVFLTDVVE